MNETLLKIIKSREDISEYLFHFTKGTGGKETLKKIVESSSLRDISSKGVICFTESPLTMLPKMFDIFNRYAAPMYAQYGVGLKKSHLYNLGARPVIYGSANEKNELGDSLKWRFEEYSPNVKDFTWLREWRIKQGEVNLDKENCFIITKVRFELGEILFNENEIVDVQIDGCVDDGKFWGYGTGIYSRAFKGLSFEDLAEFNSLSKAELDNLLSAQSLDDTIERGLGSF